MGDCAGEVGRRDGADGEDQVSRTRIRQETGAAGDSGSVYCWAPKWDEVREIFVVAAATEIFNTEQSGKWDELKEFADTAKHTIDMVLQQAAKRMERKSHHPSLKAGA